MKPNISTSSKRPRKQYTKPALRKLGALTDLTWSGTGGAADGGMPMA